jgi:glucan 1,3-beta-glucosidase
MKFHLLLSVFTHCIVAIPTITIVKSLGKRETCPLTRTDPDGFWYEQVNHNGISPFIQDGSSWPVFRNVKAYGAKGDGLTDDSAAIQDAIDAGNSFSGRSSNSLGTTGQPAVVYFPAGTYLLTRPLQLYVGTMVVGNPMHVPTLKATSTFNSNAMIRGKDPSHGSTDNFQIAIKNMIIDSQNVDRGTAITLLDWSISQACQLTNVVFHMPYESTGHTGVAMPEYGSPLMINDCAFIGGAVGVVVNTQQYHLKGLTFSGCSTGVKVKSTFDLVVQNCTFEFCTVGVDTSGTNIGFVAVIDSTANYVDTLISSAGSTTGADSLVLENVRVSETTWTVTAGGIGVLMGGVSANQAWVWGKAYAADADGSRQVTGTTFDTVRPSVLTDRSGTFKTVRPPTYQEYSAGQVINVKDVPDYLVTGDGATDDTASLQHIITTYAGCKILFFPHGTYLVTDTLTFPPGSRVFGEAWSAISAKGSAFTDATHPRPMIRVGEPGDVGVAQFSDMFFTVADVLPGCTLLEVNMAGEEAGDVGFWNTHIRVGGATGSRVRTSCAGTPGECSAAFMMVHLTASSSAYIDNMWAWTADVSP